MVMLHFSVDKLWHEKSLDSMSSRLDWRHKNENGKGFPVNRFLLSEFKSNIAIRLHCALCNQCMCIKGDIMQQLRKGAGQPSGPGFLHDLLLQ